jgi:hypothetical protein
MHRALYLLMVILVVAPNGRAGKEDSAKPEELARAAALDFAKAFNARSADPMMKVSAVPFLLGRQTVGPTNFGPENLLIKTEKELRAKLGGKVRGTLPGEVQQIVKYAAHRGQLLVSADEARALDEAVGKDGLIVYLREKGEEGVFPVFVRVDRGQARVVGYLWTRPEK